MDKKRKNILIGGLIAIVLVMAVGYAAFATNLNITSSAQTTSTWDIEITNIVADKTATCSDTSDPSTCSTVGDISHSITDNNLTANFSSALISPGDSVVYTITVQNKGTLDATLSTLTKRNSNNEAISFEIAGIAEGDSLAANQSKQFTATVTYVNQGAGQGQPASTSASFGLTLNYTQYAAAPTPSTETVYAWNTTGVTIGTSTKADLVSTKTAQPYYTSAADVMSASGYPFYNMYKIEGNTITEGYSCQTFGISGLETCVQGDDSSYYGDDTTGNKGILKTLSTNPLFIGATPTAGSCNFNSNGSNCFVGALRVTATSFGYASALDTSSGDRCDVGDSVSGLAACAEW